MTRFALRGLAGRKLRSVLTALAIVLGVATVSGTYVLTDSISSAFDTIFSSVYRGTDAAITGKSAVSADSNTNLPPFDESALIDPAEPATGRATQPARSSGGPKRAQSDPRPTATQGDGSAEPTEDDAMLAEAAGGSVEPSDRRDPEGNERPSEREVVDDRS